MDNLLLSLTGSAVAGALTFVSPQGWSPRVRRAYVVVPGVLVAAGGALALARITAGPVAAGSGTEPGAEEASPPARRPPVAARVAVPLVLGAATCGIQAGSLWIDAALEDWLVRRGAAHPRRWMALLAVVSSLGIDAVGARAAVPAADGRPAPWKPPPRR